MAKKGGKLAILAAVGAACAGAYYVYKKKNEAIPENMEDEDLNLDDGTAAAIDETEADAEGQAEEKTEEKAEEKTEGKRAYTSLSFSDVEKKAKDIGEKVASSAEKAAGVLSEKFQSAATRVEEFFDDKKNAADAIVSEAKEEAAEEVKEAAEEVKEAAEEASAEEKTE
jgi:hypothetical protein